MSDAKHTPGPWFWHGDTIHSADGRIVMTPYADGSSACLLGRGQDAGVSPEDRSLISAAPEMLEALEEVDGTFWKFCPDPESRYGQAWKTVRDVMAKAKGEK